MDTLHNDTIYSSDSPLAPHHFDYSSSVVLSTPSQPENDLATLFKRANHTIRDIAYLLTLENFSNRQHPAFQTMLNTPFAAERLGVRNLTVMKNASHEESTHIISAMHKILKERQPLTLENVLRKIRNEETLNNVKSDLVSALITTFLLFQQYPQSAAAFYAQLNWELFTTATQGDVLKIKNSGVPVIVTHASSPKKNEKLPEFIHFFFKSVTSHTPEEVEIFMSHQEGTHITNDTVFRHHGQLSHYGLRVFAAMEKGLEIHESDSDFFPFILRQLVHETPIIHFYEQNFIARREKITHLQSTQLFEKLRVATGSFLILLTSNDSTEVLHSFFGISLPETIHLLQLSGNKIIIDSGIHAFDSLISDISAFGNPELELISFD